MTDYAELRAAMEAATPGPWHTNTQCPGLCCWHIFPSVPMFGAGEDAPIVMGECSEADARFMTLARNALPALLAERDHYANECHEQARLLGMSAERELKLLAERDALREALRWTAGALQASCVAGKITEADTARALIGNETKSIGQILDAADAALAQEES